MKRGNWVQRLADGRSFGKGQMILRQGDGLVAASEPRADGLAIVERFLNFDSRILTLRSSTKFESIR